MRCLTFTAMTRLKYGFGSALLPPLLLLRCYQNLAKRRRFVGQYFRCLPLISLYVMVGAFGEMVGYFLGGSNSLEKVE
jgi:hypothetical protein